MTESILPETDDDAVRIMTIHGAKGLEFPITIVSGMSTRPSGRPAAGRGRLPGRPGASGYRFGTQVSDRGVRGLGADRRADGASHERIRLLYVACTRARDHLVVSLHRAGAGARRQAAAEPDQRRAARRRHGRPGSTTCPTRPRPPGRSSPAAAAGARRRHRRSTDWAAERAAALWRRRLGPTTVAATALTDEGAPDGGGRAGPRAAEAARATSTCRRG